jgi:hypothetical protein
MDQEHKDRLVKAMIEATRDAEQSGKHAIRGMQRADNMVAGTFAVIAARCGLFALAMREALKEIR